MRSTPVLEAGVVTAAVMRLEPSASATPDSSARRAKRAYGWESLTPTERSVTELVAEGLTNRQAAEQLFLSPHTVGFHLRAIFRKLDVTSRIDLARLVVQRGTTGPDS
jgi:DNA-binding CsgD family transcriptional regulator